jgi:PadR family transcriptional regulator PadR
VLSNIASMIQSLRLQTNRERYCLSGLAAFAALAPGPLHGLGVSHRIEQITKGTFKVKPGSLFPALHRMEEAGWLQSSWGESENNRRAKYYRLTAAGRRQFDAEAQDWQRISLAITTALKAT